MGSTTNYYQAKKPWSTFKDKMLDWYLTPYIYMLLSIPKPLYIIDCFAGKGKFDDGNIGSPLIIADKIQKTQEDIKQTNKNIYGIFIEIKYFRQLKDNLKDYNNCKVLEGSFEQNIDEICKYTTEGNSFLYIDPYGIKSLNFDSFKRIFRSSKNSIEVFINFNSIGFIREACRILKYKIKDIIEEGDDESYEIDENDLSIEKMNQIFNGNSWVDLINKFYKDELDIHTLEENLVKNYLSNYRTKFRYTINIPIRMKQKNIPKYRMIFCTNNENGLLLMHKNMFDTMSKMKDIELNGQISLFEIYKNPSDTKILEDNIWDILLKKGKIRYKELVCQIINETGLQYSEREMQNVLNYMKEQNIINTEIRLKKGYTPRDISKLKAWNSKNYDTIIIRCD